MEREGSLGRLGPRHGRLLVRLPPILFFPEDLSVEGHRGRLGDVVGFEVHGPIPIFLFLFGSGLFVEPGLPQRLSLVFSTLAHGEGIRHRDVILSFATFLHHVLLMHQLLFERSLEAPFDIIGVFVLETLRLSPSRVDISDCEAAKDELFVGSQLATPTEVLNEEVPSDALFFVVTCYAQEKTIEGLSFLVSRLPHDVVQTPVQVLIIADVAEEFFHFDVVEMLLLTELACNEDTSESLNHLMLHVDDAFPFDELHGIFFDDSEGACQSLHLFATLQELLSSLLRLDHLVQRAFVSRSRVERRRLLHFRQLLWDLSDGLLDIASMHMLLKVVFELLPLGRENFLALSRRNRHLWRQLKVIPHPGHLLLRDTRHALLDHESVHLHVWLETASVGRIRQRVILVVHPDFKVLLLLSEHLVETLYITPFQIKLLLDCINARLILLQ